MNHALLPGMRRSYRGFSLVELLVVILIIMILVTILFPIFGQSREKARQARCQGNLRQIAMALTMHTQEHGEKMAKAVDWVEQAQLEDKLLDCPSDNHRGNRSEPDYFYVAGAPRNTFLSDATLADIRAPEMAPLVVDLQRTGAATRPYIDDTPANPGLIDMPLEQLAKMISTRHARGVNIVFVDGHTEYVKWEDAPDEMLVYSYINMENVDGPAWLGFSRKRRYPLANGRGVDSSDTTVAGFNDNWRKALVRQGLDSVMGITRNLPSGNMMPDTSGTYWGFSDGVQSTPTIWNAKSGGVTGKVFQAPTWWELGRTGDSSSRCSITVENNLRTPEWQFPIGDLQKRWLFPICVLGDPSHSGGGECHVTLHIVPKGSGHTAKRLAIMVSNHRDSHAVARLDRIVLNGVEQQGITGLEWKTRDGYPYDAQAASFVVPVRAHEPIDISYSIIQYAGGHKSLSFLMIEK